MWRQKQKQKQMQMQMHSPVVSSFFFTAMECVRICISVICNLDLASTIFFCSSSNCFFVSASIAVEDARARRRRRGVRCRCQCDFVRGWDGGVERDNRESYYDKDCSIFFIATSSTGRWAALQTETGLFN